MKKRKYIESDLNKGLHIKHSEQLQNSSPPTKPAAPKHPLFENLTDDEIEKQAVQVLANFPKHLPACGPDVTVELEGNQIHCSGTWWVCEDGCVWKGKVLQ